MARRTKPHHKMCRRVGVPLCGDEQCPSVERSYPPGEMGRRRFRLSDYGIHLREKQKLKYTYGILEKQLRRYYEDSKKAEGNTGQNLVIRLERRLDNCVYRLQFGKTRPQARQFVNHEHIYVNGEKASIPSSLIEPGDVITPAPNDTSERLVEENLNPVQRDILPTWMDRDKDNLRGEVKDIPKKDEVPQHIDELMVVEFLSR